MPMCNVIVGLYPIPSGGTEKLISVKTKSTSAYGSGSFEVSLGDDDGAYYAMFTQGDEVIIFMDDTNPGTITNKIFGGYLESMELDNTNARVLILRGPDFTSRLMQKLVPAGDAADNSIRLTGTFTSVLTTLLTYQTEFTTNIPADATPVDMVFYKGTLYNAIDQLCQAYDYYFRVTPDKVFTAIKRTTQRVTTDSLVYGTNLLSIEEEKNSQLQTNYVTVMGGQETLSATQTLSAVAGTNGMWYEFPAAYSPPLKPLTGLTQNAGTLREGLEFDVDYTGNPKGTPTVKPAVRIRDANIINGATVIASYEYQKQAVFTWYGGGGTPVPKMEKKLTFPSLSQADCTAYAKAYYNVYNGEIKVLSCKSRFLRDTDATNYIYVTADFFGYSGVGPASLLQVNNITHEFTGAGIWTTARLIDRMPDEAALRGMDSKRIRQYEDELLRQADSENVAQLYGGISIRDYAGGANPWKARYMPPIYIAPSNADLYGFAMTPLTVKNIFSYNLAFFEVRKVDAVATINSGAVYIGHSSPVGATSNATCLQIWDMSTGNGNALQIQYYGRNSSALWVQTVLGATNSDSISVSHGDSGSGRAVGVGYTGSGNAIGISTGLAASSAYQATFAGNNYLNYAIDLNLTSYESRGIRIDGPVSGYSSWDAIQVYHRYGNALWLRSDSNALAGIYCTFGGNAGSSYAIQLFLTGSNSKGIYISGPTTAAGAWSGFYLVMNASAGRGVYIYNSATSGSHRAMDTTLFAGYCYYATWYGIGNSAIRLDCMNDRSHGMVVISPSAPASTWYGMSVQGSGFDIGYGLYIHGSGTMASSWRGIYVDCPGTATAGYTIHTYGRPAYFQSGMITSYGSTLPSNPTNGQIHIYSSGGTRRIYAYVAGVWRSANLV